MGMTNEKPYSKDSPMNTMAHIMEPSGPWTKSHTPKETIMASNNKLNTLCLGNIRALSLIHSSNLNQAIKLPVNAMPPMSNADREIAI